MAIAVCSAAAVALLAGSAAAGIVSSLGVAKRTVAGRQTTIVVDRRGDTVYALGGESLARLKCISAQCLKVWQPVQVRSATAKVPQASGVPGTVSILRRVKAKIFQVMLDKHPLYYYSGDTKIGSTKGQGVKSFGGTWQVVKAG